MKKGHYVKAKWKKGKDIIDWAGPFDSRHRATLYIFKKTDNCVGKIDILYKEVK